VDGPGRRRPKEDEDYWLKDEDKDEWSKTVEQTKTHTGL
jgi:hypothetical protein